MTGSQMDGTDTLETTVLLVLPPGVDEVGVTAAEGATLRSSETHRGSSTQDTLVVAHLSVTSQPCRGDRGGQRDLDQRRRQQPGRGPVS